MNIETSDNIKEYCRSKQHKKRNAGGKNNYYKTYGNKTCMKSKRGSIDYSCNKLDIDYIDNHKYANYNINYLQRFSNININNINAKYYNPVTTSCNINKYNQHQHYKKKNSKSWKKLVNKTSSYSTADYMHCNYKQLHKVYNNNSNGYAHYDDLCCFKGPFFDKVRCVKASNNTYYADSIRQRIYERCNWNMDTYKCQLVQMQKMSTKPSCGSKHKLLLYLLNRYHLWIEVEDYIVLNHPSWFKQWIINKMNGIQDRYNTECYKHRAMRKCYNIPVICRKCNKYCCNSRDCYFMDECRACHIKKEYKGINNSLLSMDKLVLDIAVINIITQYTMGVIWECQSILCNKILSFHSKFDYLSSYHHKLYCNDCDTLKTLKTLKTSVSDKQKIKVVYNMNEKKYKYKYSDKGWNKWLDGIPWKLPIIGNKKYHRSSSERVIRNALFMNNFDILHENIFRDLTNVLLEYGDLKKNVYINLDKNNDPFAIAQFVKDEDAEFCKNDGIIFGEDIKVNIEWVDRNINNLEYRVKNEIINDFDMNEVSERNVKSYNNSKHERNKKKRIKMRNKIDRKRKYGKKYGEKRWNDRRNNKKSNKKLINRVCKMERENIKKKTYDFE